jgi:hypothetical protein
MARRRHGLDASLLLLLVMLLHLGIVMMLL